MTGWCHIVLPPEGSVLQSRGALCVYSPHNQGMGSYWSPSSANSGVPSLIPSKTAGWKWSPARTTHRKGSGTPAPSALSAALLVQTVTANQLQNPSPCFSLELNWDLSISKGHPDNTWKDLDIWGGGHPPLSPPNLKTPFWILWFSRNITKWNLWIKSKRYYRCSRTSSGVIAQFTLSKLKNLSFEHSLNRSDTCTSQLK